jgi:hypothetical protein
VRVTTGPVDTVEDELFAGLGNGNFRAGVGRESKVEGSDMRTAEFDLTSDAGKEAYRRFMLSGKVPPSTTPGVVASGRIETLSLDSKAVAELKLGDFGGRWELNSTFGERQTIHWDDGRRDESIYLRNNDRALGMQRSFDAGGKLEPGGSYTVIGANTDPAFASYAKLAFEGGTRPDLQGQQDVQLELSEQQLLDLRQRARDYVAKNGDQMAGDLIGALAGSKDAHEVATFLVSQDPSHTMDGVFEKLLALRHDDPNDTPLPGTVRVRSV